MSIEIKWNQKNVFDGHHNELSSMQSNFDALKFGTTVADPFRRSYIIGPISVR